MTAADYIHKNFYWCIFWGFVLQCVGGSVAAMRHSPSLIVLGWSIYIAGTAVLLIGFSVYVKSKGRNPAWSLLALLWLIGWVILILLRDRSHLSVSEKNPKMTLRF